MFEFLVKLLIGEVISFILLSSLFGVFLILGISKGLDGGMVRTAVKKSVKAPVNTRNSTWYDYDRNCLDNDIEQIRHVDGIGGR